MNIQSFVNYLSIYQHHESGQYVPKTVNLINRRSYPTCPKMSYGSYGSRSASLAAIFSALTPVSLVAPNPLVAISLQHDR